MILIPHQIIAEIISHPLRFAVIVTPGPDSLFLLPAACDGEPFILPSKSSWLQISITVVNKCIASYPNPTR